MAVFVLDKHKKPLMPCTEKRARLLLQRGRARVHKMEPFTIRLVDRLARHSELQPLRVKLDPGSKTTGFAVTLEQPTSNKVVLLGEIVHKQGISDALASRRSLRSSRRNRKLRYRKKRFDNRVRPKGWITPSMRARVEQTLNALKKLQKLSPLQLASCENVKFDMQKLMDPDVEGKGYQQGELFGYEIREYLLEKFEHSCAYCKAKDKPLQVEHYIPKSHGGTNRISNLAIACEDCNQAKGSLLPSEWITKLSRSKKALDEVRLKHFISIESQLKKTLKDAASVNTTRKVLSFGLKELFSEVELASGGLTKFNRTTRGLPKTHFFDALCVGKSTPEVYCHLPAYAAIWESKGRGNRQMARVDKYGFPKGYRERKKSCHGFQTGDIAKADVTKGKKIGKYKGRILIRHSGSFSIKCLDDRLIDGISYKYFKILQRNDGWMYNKKPVS